MSTTQEPPIAAPIHLTLTQGYTIACRPVEQRASIDPLPAIVELVDHDKITCSDCMLRAADEIERRANNPKPAVAQVPALDRIAVALERIADCADILVDPHRMADIVALAIVRSR